MARIRGAAWLYFLGLACWTFEALATDSCGFSPTYRHRIAICVGINEYSEYPSLNYAVNDALAMAAVFQSYGFDRVTVLRNQEATREAILRIMEHIREQVDEEDFVVFFFAGHGVTLRGRAGTSEGVLIPYGARPGHEMEDALPMGKVAAWARELKARHTLLLMDACYSGLGIENRAHCEPVSRQTRGRKTTRTVRYDARAVEILTAGGEMDRAFEFDGHGLFTRSLLDCLADGSPESADGFVTGLELAQAVRARVAAETGGWQTPQFAAVGDGDLVLRRSSPVLASAGAASAVR